MPERIMSRLLRRFPRQGMLWAGLALVGSISLAALLAPWLAPFDPTALDVNAILVPPGGLHHLLGTDALGRDVLSRLLYGGRTTAATDLDAAAREAARRLAELAP